MLKQSKLFNEAWKQQAITKPVVVLIGGYAGTGKSTLAAQLSKELAYAQVIPTGIFRSIAQTQQANASSKKQPLFLATYDLHTVYGSGKADIRRAYEEQCLPVTDIISSVINFMATEKQHIIIEGNHVLPWHSYKHLGCNLIEIYLYVKNPSQHQQMLGGPTHNRNIDQRQFMTGRLLHDILYKEALSNEKPLFECSEMQRARHYFSGELKKIIQTDKDWQNVK